MIGAAPAGEGSVRPVCRTSRREGTVQIRLDLPCSLVPVALLSCLAGAQARAVPRTIDPAPVQGVSKPKAGAETPPRDQGGDEKKGMKTLPGVRRAGSLPQDAIRKSSEETGRNEAPLLARAKKALKLRLYPDPKAPVVSPDLPPGHYLWCLGEKAKGFLKVRIPGGFTGYVHRRYLEAKEDGSAVVTARRVSFRHEPKKGSGTFPVALLPKGTKLWMLGVEGDWARVLAPEYGIAWVPEGGIEELGLRAEGLPEELRKKLEGQALAARAPFEAVRREMAAKAARAEKLAALGRLLDQVLEVYRKETDSKPLVDEDLGKIRKMFDPLKRKLAALNGGKEELVFRFEAFEEELAGRELIQRSALALREDPAEKAAEAAAKKPTSSVAPLPDRRRFEATGWVEYRPGFGDWSPYRLVKGGKVLFYLSCPSGRYDLQDFVGLEVGVKGARSLPRGADFRVLEASRLVILGRR